MSDADEIERLRKTIRLLQNRNRQLSGRVAGLHSVIAKQSRKIEILRAELAVPRRRWWRWFWPTSLRRL